MSRICYYLVISRKLFYLSLKLMIIFFQVFTRTAPPPQLSLEDSPYPQNAAMFISSIARTNLECDIVQRGGTLVQGRGFADMVAAFNKASTSGATPKVAKMTFDSNRNKFCFGESSIIFMILIMDYGHTMAKSLYLCGPNSNLVVCFFCLFILLLSKAHLDLLKDSNT